MKTIKALVSGTVQAVFFRRFVRDRADELKIKGFVRNLDDGRVEIIAEGEDGKVNEFIKRCEKGPNQASVKNIEIHDMKHQGFDSFKILSM